MRRLLKFLHTMGAIGLMGAMASLLVMLYAAPDPTVALSEFTAVRVTMSAIAQWILLPSMGLTLIAGLLAIAANRALHNAGWAWIKLATGILVFEGGLTSVQGPMQEDVTRASHVLAGHGTAASLVDSLAGQKGALWVLLAVGVANVVLGVWRPKIIRSVENFGAIPAADAQSRFPPNNAVSKS